MQQPARRPGFDMGGLTTSDKLVLAGSGLYFIWSFIPTWYKISICGALGINVPGCNGSISGWHGVTLIAALLALVAVVWTGLRLAGVTSNMNMGTLKPGAIDLGIGGLALLLTLLGLAVKPTGFGISWGLFVAILLAIVWTYGAYMKYQEPATAAGPAAPPPPPSGGGFTT